MWRVYQAGRRIYAADRAVRNPGRYAKNRAKSKLLGGVGFWQLMNKMWRA